MIKSETEYRITQEWAQRFEENMRRGKAGPPDGTDPQVTEIAAAAFRGKFDTLRDELRERVRPNCRDC